MELNAEIRTGKGKGPARVTRRGNRIPAVLYGRNLDTTTSLSIDRHEFELFVKQGRVRQNLINLKVGGAETPRSTMIKEIQVHPVSGNFMHVDFYEVDMSRKVRVKIPVKVTGKAKGVELGGMFQMIRRQLEVLCFPNNIPEDVVLDISDLDIGDAIHIEDIQFPEGVEPIHEVNFTVVTILSPSRAEVESKGEGEGEGEGGEGAESGEAAETEKASE